MIHRSPACTEPSTTSRRRLLPRFCPSMTAGKIGRHFRHAITHTDCAVHRRSYFAIAILFRHVSARRRRTSSATRIFSLRIRFSAGTSPGPGVGQAGTASNIGSSRMAASIHGVSLDGRLQSTFGSRCTASGALPTRTRLFFPPNANSKRRSGGWDGTTVW